MVVLRAAAAVLVLATLGCAGIPVGSDPWDVQYAEGTVWVTNNVDGTVTRHDPRTGKLVATIETGASPANITAAYGSVWIGSTSGTEIFRIDPATNGVTALEAGKTPTSIEASSGGPDAGRATFTAPQVFARPAERCREGRGNSSSPLPEGRILRKPQP